MSVCCVQDLKLALIAKSNVIIAVDKAEVGDLVSNDQFSSLDSNGNRQVSREEVLSLGAKDFSTADNDESAQ